ncbi:MAG: hypothetical protein ACPGOY_15050 [Rhodospirillaceae bacterium]
MKGKKQLLRTTFRSKTVKASINLPEKFNAAVNNKTSEWILMYEPKVAFQTGFPHRAAQHFLPLYFALHKSGQ